MNKIILIMLVIISSTIISQPKITAKHNKDIANSIAHTYASDALLLLVTSTDVDSSGLSNNWQYVYASFSESQEYHFMLYADSIKYEETKPLRVGIGVIGNDWVDSDSALEVIKNNGGRNFISHHPNCTIEASLLKYISPPLDTYWRVNLKANDSTFTLHQNAETGEIFTSILDKEEIINSNFVIYQNYPNPFNPSTTISYNINESSRLVVKIYDINGKEIKTLLDSYQSSGLHKIQFDGKEFSSGIYFCKIHNTRYSKTIKMLLVK